MTKIIINKKPACRQARSFTLIEVLVACAILIILVAAVVALGVTIINNAVLSRQRISAYYLAQEGIETIRQIRDSNLVDGREETGWKTLNYQWGVVNPFRDVVADGTTIYSVVVEAPPERRLFLGPTGYGQDIVVDGVTYRRKITFASAGIDIPGVNVADNAVRAIVSISWKFKNNDKEIEVRELITNWKQQL